MQSSTLKWIPRYPCSEAIMVNPKAQKQLCLTQGSRRAWQEHDSLQRTSLYHHFSYQISQTETVLLNHFRQIYQFYPCLVLPAQICNGKENYLWRIILRGFLEICLPLRKVNRGKYRKVSYPENLIHLKYLQICHPREKSGIRKNLCEMDMDSKNQTKFIFVILLFSFSKKKKNVKQCNM